MQADEMYCWSCGKPMKREAVMCVSCGVPAHRARVPAYSAGPAGRGEGKSKVASILLAIFLGNWTWLYTYREDGAKFWIALTVLVVGFILSLATLGIGFVLYIPASLGIWIWSIVDAVSRTDEWYANY